jgi:hypothetical protein
MKQVIFDSNQDLTYIPEEEENSNADDDVDTDSISGKYTALNHLCYKLVKTVT